MSDPLDFDALLTNANRWPRVWGCAWRCPSCSLPPTFCGTLFGVVWSCCSCCGLRQDTPGEPLAWTVWDAEEAATLFTHVGCHDPVDGCPVLVRPFGVVAEKGNLMSVSKPEDRPLLNAALRAHARGLELAKASEPKPPTPPTPDELQTSSNALKAAPDNTKAIVERTAAWYADHGPFYEWHIGNQWLNGTEAAQRLRLGDDLALYLRAQNGGRQVPRDRRRC